METKSKTVWDAFGAYVAKVMRNGKGVWVPRFGIFTFSAMNVDLAVSYCYKIRLILFCFLGIDESIS